MTTTLLQQALDALEWLLANIRRDAPQLSGKAMGNAESACTAIRAHLAAQPAPAPEEFDMADDGGCPVCGEDGGTSCGMPNCGLLSAAPVPVPPGMALVSIDELAKLRKHADFNVVELAYEQRESPGPFVGRAGTPNVLFAASPEKP
jgi:hypothetical protein